jgi:hypothetical protein
MRDFKYLCRSCILWCDLLNMYDLCSPEHPCECFCGCKNTNPDGVSAGVS